MYSKIKPEANNSLTSSEMIILKSFALGLDVIQFKVYLKLMPIHINRIVK